MKKISFLLAITSFCLVLLGCGGDNGKSDTGANNKFASPKEAGYYSDLRVTPNGTFLVRGKIKDGDAAKSGLVFKVEMNNKKQIIKITSLDGGKPIDATWEDTMNKAYWGSFAVVSIEYQDNYAKYVFKDQNLYPVDGLYGAYSIRYKFDGLKKQFTDAYVYDENGEHDDSYLVFSHMIFTYDDKGELVSIGYATKNGERIANQWVPYETRLKYDKDNNTIFPIEVANYSKDGALMMDRYGIAKTSYRYDAKGRLTEIRFWGTDEALKIKNAKDRKHFEYRVMPTQHAFGAMTKYFYTDNGDKPNKIVFYGEDGNPLALNEQYPFATVEYTYTKEGRIETVALFGIDDLPCTETGEGVAKCAYEYGPYGDVISTSYYGKDGKLVTFKPNLPYAIKKGKYNDKRQLVEMAYFGIDGNPVQFTMEINSQKCLVHRFVDEYNDDNKRIRIIYYDKEGKEVGQQKPNY